MATGYELDVHFVFDREQSCIEIRAKFEKEDISLSTEKHQRMRVKFYADAAENPA